jgi:hypothetical protein
MTAIRRLFRNSGLLFVLAFGLLALPACDSGGSNGGGGGGGGGNGGGGGGGTFGPSNPSGPNAFELSFSSSSSASSASKAGLAKATTTYKGYSFQFQGPGNGQDFFAIFFSSKNSFSSGATSGPELFGVLAMQRSSIPGAGTYSISSAGGGPNEFYGLIGQNFDEPENTGTRTLQFFQSGSVTLTKKDGELTVSDFNNVEAWELVFDVANDELETQIDPQNPPTVSVNLNGEIVPKTTSAFARPSFGFSVSTGTGGGGGDTDCSFGSGSTGEDVVTTTDALDGRLKIKIQGTDDVDYRTCKTTDGSTRVSGGTASGPESGFSEPFTTDSGVSGFDTYKLVAKETEQADASFTLTLLKDGSEVASVTEPADDGNDSATIEVQAP